jgi:hypothetical protein
MKRSGFVEEIPLGVEAETRPPDVPVGTLNLIEVVDAEANPGRERLSVTTSLEIAESKLDPESVTSSPAAATVGEIEEIWGTEDSPTVKPSALVTGPSSGVETVTEPVVVPIGTLTFNEVAVAALTVAVVPLNLTVSEAGVVENPVPSIVTVAPTSPLAGLSWTIDRAEDAWREIESRFPAASQL